MLHSAAVAFAAFAKVLPLLVRKMRDGKSVRISPGRIVWDFEAWSPQCFAIVDGCNGLK
jgi:hypothetical protein